MKSVTKAILLIALLFPAFLGFATNNVTANFSVDVYINDAWYGDLDNDGNSDDVGIHVTVYVSNNYVYTHIDLYGGVEKPSGDEYWHLESFIMEKYTYTGYIEGIFELYNTATESGWYTAMSVGFADGEQFSYMDTLSFDPPGSNGGGPSGLFTYI